jgi:hypothetical protein
MKTLRRSVSVLLAATLALMTACAVPVTLNNRRKNVKLRLRILSLMALFCALVATPRIANGLDVKPPGNRSKATAASDFVVVSHCDDQTKPVAGYDWWSGQYLVVWEDWCHGFDYDSFSRPWIDAARVTSAGDVIPCGRISYLNFDALGNSIVARRSPSIAFDWVAHRYLVVWSNTTSSGSEYLMGRLVTPNCEKQPAFVITDSYSYFQPSVAYSADAGEYLVVYTDGTTVRGQRVDSQTGTLVGLPMLLVDQTALHFISEPVVAYDQVSHSYLLVWWENEILGPTLVRMRIVNSDGSGTGAETISGIAGVPSAPRVSYEPETNRFLVTWDVNGFILGRVFHIEGASLLDDTGISIIAAPNDGYPRSRPELSYDFHNHGFVVAYERQYSANDTDVMALLLDSSGGVMAGERPLRAAYHNEAHPAIQVGDGGRYLLVWEDSRNQANTNLDLYGAIYVNSRAFVPSVLR